MKKSTQLELITLFAIYCVGEKGTSKRVVLDFIQEHKLFSLSPTMSAQLSSRNEPVWENKIAWVRNSLARNGFLDQTPKNFWALTQKGTAHLTSLFLSFLSEAPNHTNVYLGEWFEMFSNEIASEKNPPAPSHAP
jgi:restriction endonuclease Mrr